MPYSLRFERRSKRNAIVEGIAHNAEVGGTPHTSMSCVGRSRRRPVGLGARGCGLGERRGVEHRAQRRSDATKVFGVRSGNPRQLAVGRALGRRRFAGSLGRRLAEEHDWTNEFGAEVLGEVGQQQQLLPVVRWRAAAASGVWHLPGPFPKRGAMLRSCHTNCNSVSTIIRRGVHRAMERGTSSSRARTRAVLARCRG